MRIQLIALSCVVLSGCTFGVATCKTNDDCETGSTCSPGGFCIAGSSETGGGSGGGTAAGGGSGGGTAGGGTTTGGGGGVPAVCEGIQCAPYEECLSVDGGPSCQVTNIQIEWLTPPDNSRHNQTAVPGIIRVTHGGLAIWQLDSLPVAGASAFRFDGGVWYGSLDLTGIPTNSAKDFVAGWPDAGVSSTRRIYFDTTPPEVVLTVLQRQPDAGDEDPDHPGFWKKDEAALIQVSVDGGRAPITADIQTSWGGPITPVDCQCGATCGCFAIDLKQAPLLEYAGTVPVGIGQIPDEVGNNSNVVADDISVTRFKWQRSALLEDSSASVLPAGVSRSGLVVFGGSKSAGASATSGALNAVTQTGQVSWRRTSSDYRDPYIPTGGGTGVFYGDATIVAGPVIGNSGVWVATRSSVTALGEQHHLKNANSSDGTATPSCSFTSNAFGGPIVLSYSSAGEVPLAVRYSGTAQEVVAVSNGNCREYDLPVTSTATAPSIVGFSRDGGNTEVYVAFGDTPQFSKLNISSLTGSASVNSSLMLPSNPVTQPKGLFVDGTSFVGGGGASGSGSVWALNSVDFDAGSISYLPIVSAGPVALGVGYVVYGDNAGSAHRDSYANGSLDAGFSQLGGIGSLSGTPPIIGEGGLIYFVSASGAVTVRESATLAEAWHIPGVGADRVAPGALDVYRSLDGGKDCSVPLGVLYVAAGVGAQSQLRAILVDSRGLDPQAPWPKFQRDNANTGNASQSTSYWTCP